MNINIRSNVGLSMSREELNSLFENVLISEKEKISVYLIPSIKEILCSSEKADTFIKQSGLDLYYVSADQIKKFNTLYRSVNKSTDVLSFPAIAHKESMQKDDIFFELGEIFLCPEIVKKYALEDKGEIYKNEDMSKEFLDMEKETLIHGFLHLLGYDHENSEEEEREMLKRQKEYAELRF